MTSHELPDGGLFQAKGSPLAGGLERGPADTRRDRLQRGELLRHLKREGRYSEAELRASHRSSEAEAWHEASSEAG